MRQHIADYEDAPEPGYDAEKYLVTDAIIVLVIALLVAMHFAYFSSH